MKTNDLQIIYPASNANQDLFHDFFLPEINALKAAGFNVATRPSCEAKRLILRSFIINKETDFPKDKRYLQSWKQYISTSDMSRYLPLIDDISIPSFLVESLDETVVDEINQRGWNRAFIRTGMKSLWHNNKKFTIWPDSSIEEIKHRYQAQKSLSPPYVVRKFIEGHVMLAEERYWILNHHAYHRSGIIPDIVNEAIDRMRQVGSTYYVIDATPDFVVEINPGISSDRYGDNPPELFAKWFAEEFLL